MTLKQRWLGGLIAGAWLAAAHGAARLPIEDFTRTAEFGQMQLSPDGTSIGFLRDFNGRSHLCVARIFGTGS